MSKQPRDDANYPIPVLSYLRNGGWVVNMNTSIQEIGPFANATRVISVYATDDCLFEIGQSTTLSHFLPAAFYLDFSLGSEQNSSNNSKYITVQGASGSFYVSERV